MNSDDHTNTRLTMLESEVAELKAKLSRAVTSLGYILAFARGSGLDYVERMAEHALKMLGEEP